MGNDVLKQKEDDRLAVCPGCEQGERGRNNTEILSMSTLQRIPHNKQDMIERKKKTCIDCNTEQVIWSHGRCRRCDGIYRMRGLNTANKTPQPPFKSIKPIVYVIPPRTKKREIQEREYHIICGIIDREEKERGNWKCWFCGGKFRLDYTPSHHHVYGRDGDALVRKEDIRLAHVKCHDEYHHRSVHKISWYNKWLSRIKHTDRLLHEKELIKLNK